MNKDKSKITLLIVGVLGAVWLLGAQQKSPELQWEYTTIIGSTRGALNVFPSDFDSKINKLGKDRWELITFDHSGPQEYVAILKRTRL
jgi:hypothetical protein